MKKKNPENSQSGQSGRGEIKTRTDLHHGVSAGFVVTRVAFALAKLLPFRIRHVLQVFKGIQTGGMTIGPGGLHGVTADQIQALQLEGLR